MANKGHEKENRKFLGGGGLYMTPLERKFRGGGGGLIGRTIRGRGMDIFWNHTMCTISHQMSSDTSRAVEMISLHEKLE